MLQMVPAGDHFEGVLDNGGNDINSRGSPSLYSPPDDEELTI